MRTVGQFVAKIRGVGRHFRSSFDEMVREAELKEMEETWAKENARIMREHPPEEAHDAVYAAAPVMTPALPHPDEAAAVADPHPEPVTPTAPPASPPAPTTDRA